MQASNIPAFKFNYIWAIDAAGGDVTYPIPDTPGAAGRASLQDGFPPVTFQPTTAGGIPPFGQDFNGAYQMVTSWEQWWQAGSWILPYDATFSGVVGGFPIGAVVQTSEPGSYWVSAIDNNTADPTANSGNVGNNWYSNSLGLCYAADTGSTPNAVVATLPFTRSTLAYFIGYTFRIQKNAANTGNVTLALNGFAAKAVVHPDTTQLTAGELPGGGYFTVTYDGTFFQLQSIGYLPLVDNGTQSFTSGELGWGTSQTSSASHGLGTTPAFAWWKLVCLIAEQGYSVGDVIENSFSSVSLWVNATTVGLTIGTGGIVAINKSSFGDVNLTPANWRVVLFCRTIL